MPQPDSRLLVCTGFGPKAQSFPEIVTSVLNPNNSNELLTSKITPSHNPYFNFVRSWTHMQQDIPFSTLLSSASASIGLQQRGDWMPLQIQQ